MSAQISISDLPGSNHFLICMLYPDLSSLGFICGSTEQSSLEEALRGHLLQVPTLASKLGCFIVQYPAYNLQNSIQFMRFDRDPLRVF